MSQLPHGLIRPEPSLADLRWRVEALERELHTLRAALAWADARGQAATPDPAPPASQPFPAPPAHQEPLSGREREVAALIARGMTNRQIAAALLITTQTANKHVSNILGKLALNTRAQVAVWATQHRLAGR